MDEKNLFIRLQQGDEVAFNQIYQKYYQMLYHLAMDYLKDNYLVEDVIQQVFLKLWEVREHIVIQNDLGNYLYTMAKHYILQTIRKKNSEVLQYYELSRLYHQEDKIKEEKKIEALYQAIEKLPEQKKTICLLKINEKASNEEISQRLGISIQTVKNHYNQALRFLRSNLEEKFFILIILFKHL